MNVKELIAELKGWPDDFEVVTAAADNSENEFQGKVLFVNELPNGEMKSSLAGRNAIVLRD